MFSSPSTIYATYLTISTIIQGLFIPLAMIIICSLITLDRLKLIQSHVMPINNAAQNEWRVTGQYIIMLLVQVVTDCWCNIVYLSYLIYSLVFPAPQSAQITAISSLLINMSFNVPYMNYSAAFYLYILSSPSFRRKFILFIRRLMNSIINIRTSLHYMHCLTHMSCFSIILNFLL